MEHNTSLDIFRKYFERQLEQARKTLEKSDHHHYPFITISRLTGAGGVSFPEKLVHHLNEKDSKTEHGWMFFDKNILEMVLEEHNLPKEISRFMPEGKISELQDVIEQLFGLHPSEHKLIKKVSDTILHLSHLGNVVLVGRGSNIITGYNKSGMHLRLVESMETRVEHIQDYFKMSKIEAIKLIQNEDKDRATYIKKYFSKDINNPNLYSLVINFDFIKVDEALDMICDEIIKIRRRHN
jgi:cytidylate kinase